jgi:hypothetical protein
MLPFLLCDSKHVYRGKFKNIDGRTVIESYEKVRTVSVGQNGHQTARFHNDAKRLMPEILGYPRISVTSQTSAKLDPTGTGGPDGTVLLESPRGIWYPTVTVRKYAIRAKGNKPVADLQTNLHLDFTAAIPDEVFVANVK